MEHAGECLFGAKFVPNDTNNYTTTEGVIVTVNAAKGASSVTKAPTGKTLTYNGASQVLATDGTAEGGAMAYSLDGEDFVEELPSGTAAGDYTIWYMVAGDENHNDSAVGKVTAKITKANISKAKVTLPKKSYAYTGKALKPTVKSVTLNGNKLTAGTDYTVSYANNKRRGTATVTVTGKGSCTGSAKTTFTIGLGTPKLTTTQNVATGKLRATWTKVKGAQSYQLQYRVRGGKWKTVNVKGVSRTFKGLKAGKLYDIRVRAIAGNAKGTWSTVSHRWFAGVSNVKATSTKAGTVKVAWKRSAKANAGYQVFVRYSKTGSVVAQNTVKAGKSSVIVKGLTPGKRVWVQVCALRKAGGTLYSGSLVRAKSSAKV